MNCKICFEKFDSVRFIPIICIPCAHTFCSVCLIHIKECSICRTKIKEKKTNFGMIEILEEKSPVSPKTRTINGQTQSKPNLNPKALSLKNEGVKLNSEKKFAEALQKFNESLNLCSDEFERSPIYCLISDTYRHLNNFDQALMFYKKGFESSKISAEEKKTIQNQISNCLKEYGIKLFNIRRQSEALDKFDQAIDKYTDDYADKYLILWWKAKNLKALGHNEESSLFYEFAIEAAPSAEKKREIKNQMK